MSHCIFCSIAENTSPCYKIYEDNLTLAFLDISEDVEGHTLVITKQHFHNILDCDSHNLNAVMDTVKKISTYYVDSCGYDGVNLLNANGEAAEQSVQHFHIHIIPRKKDDEVDAWPKFIGAKIDNESIYQKLKLKPT